MRILLIVFFLFFSLVGCSGTQEKIEGYILEMEENKVLVAEVVTAKDFKAIKEKSISDLNKEGISLIYFSDVDKDSLQVGNKVRIWFNGKMFTSYPAQAGAIKIEVIE
ncbi:YobA family protein [Bacillus sp. FJAT-29790]|uniref:DUF3221 domain-containing protein n=1 Tax=Bacillus sp. FJAT-29790 TaxID=1895002 RepID=UPI001C24811C|nr:DUF3221 domain-containing protein [Bacillus sp. FJAT-29790]MBU8880904.1 YobA family protein [Bacillus sp. FJAT-29790]